MVLAAGRTVSVAVLTSGDGAGRSEGPAGPPLAAFEAPAEDPDDDPGAWGDPAPEAGRAPAPPEFGVDPDDAGEPDEFDDPDPEPDGGFDPLEAPEVVEGAADGRPLDVGVGEGEPVPGAGFLVFFTASPGMPGRGETLGVVP